MELCRVDYVQGPPASPSAFVFWLRGLPGRRLLHGATMNQRSLVGMSMGARKRAARRWLWPDDNRRDALRMFREMVAESPHTRHEYRLARNPYRIGQTLRLCPGNGCRRGQSWCLRCDGTGVVSAKKAKARNVG